MNESLSPRDIAAALPELWSPRVIGELDDNYIKVARIQGVFGWHDHAHEDEMFFILQGHLRIEMEAGAVELATGAMYVVPKGVRHNPVAEQECLVMLIERKATRHSGDEVFEHTRSITEQLGPA